MTTYIVKEENAIFIYHVREDQKAAFLKDFGRKILVEGDSIHDVIGKFNHFPIILEAPK